MKTSVVVLTMGSRPRELARALDSARAQEGLDVEIVVVVNAGSDVDVDAGEDVVLVRAGENLGVAGGRNLGGRAASGELLFFLDDDATLGDPSVLADVEAEFRSDPRLAVLSLRVEAPDGRVQRAHVPRLRVGDPTRSSAVTTFLGGASCIRAEAFRAVGGFPDEFMYAHEETSLAWRLLDRGWAVRYDGSLGVVHPFVQPTRHDGARRLMARNRVLLARRHLPAVLGVVYVCSWLAISMVRDRAGAAEHLRGTRDGLRFPSVDRAPITWSTVWRLTRMGRPPVI